MLIIFTILKQMNVINLRYYKSEIQEFRKIECSHARSTYSISRERINLARWWWVFNQKLLSRSRS